MCKENKTSSGTRFKNSFIGYLCATPFAIIDTALIFALMHFLSNNFELEEMQLCSLCCIFAIASIVPISKLSSKLSDFVQAKMNS